MTIALLIEPLDLLFCRDGRPIVAGEGAAAGTAIPGPQVMAGALRSAVLRRRNQLPADGSRPAQADLDRVLTISIRGPLLADLDAGLPFIPMPADVVGEKAKHGRAGDAKARLLPLEGLPGWCAPVDAPRALPLWPLGTPGTSDKGAERHRPGELAPQSGFLTWRGFTESWAVGQVPPASEICVESDLWTTEVRTQVGLKADAATAEDGVLFTTRYLRLHGGEPISDQPGRRHRRIGLYVEVDGADDLPAEFTLSVGGDRRLCRARRLPKPVTWPTGGSVAMALTPVLLSGERCPAAWRDHCRGLAIPGADPISGWDLAANGGLGGPRPTRWGIRAGSVWHLAHTPQPTRAIGSETATGFGWVAFGTAPTL